MKLIAGSFMSKSSQLYPNPVHAYAINQMFSGNLFTCINDHGYQSNNVIMNWWTNEEQNKPLAEQAKLFGFYDAIKSIFEQAQSSIGESVNCYNIHYISKKVMLPLNKAGVFNIGVHKKEEAPVIYTQASSLTMILAPTIADFVPILITMYSTDEKNFMLESIDNIALFSSQFMVDNANERNN